MVYNNHCIYAHNLSKNLHTFTTYRLKLQFCELLTMLVVTYISLFLLSVLCIAAYLKLRISKDDTARNPTFLTFQRTYIPLYLLVVLGDWLQGPYLYRLYHYYDFVETQVAIIYVCGMISSALFFPAKDFIADKFGRKKTIVLFCVLYSLSCFATVFANYGVLLIGRCIAGLANTILFSTLETWYVHEHHETYDFPKEWVSVTFSHIAFGSSIVAVVAGVLADIFARWLSLGPMSPFVVAVPIFAIAISLILWLWKENFGEAKQVSGKLVKKSCGEGLKIIGQNVDVFLIGIIQSLFESVLFVFVFIWTPALDVFHDIPLGIAFASFMVCHMLGSIVCDYLIAKVGYSMTRLLVVISGSGAAVFFVAAYFAMSKQATFYRLKILVCLQLFELLCGFYFPIMRVLREKVLPDEHRLSIINWFRVPLTLASSMALLCFHDTSGGIPEIFVFCGIMMSLAFFCSFRFAKTLNSGDDEAGNEPDAVSS